jgi:hypothetical protein
MKFFARLESHSLAWSNGDFGARSRVTADAGLAWLDCENAEAAEFDTVSSDEGLLHAFEDRVDRGFCFCPWQSGSLNNPLYKILLNHLGRRPWAVSFVVLVLLTWLSKAMLESQSDIVNERTLP